VMRGGRLRLAPGSADARRGRPIAMRSGDVFLAGLDWTMPEEIALSPYIKGMRRKGVRVHAVVHDLIPLQVPHTCSELALNVFPKWMELVRGFDGAVCVSQTTASALSAWLKTHRPKRRSFPVTWFHPGADICIDMESSSLPDDADTILARISGGLSLLVVGTLEPRKRHRQILDAFEILWNEGMEITLVIVGEPGWGVDDLSKRLETHSEAGHRLLWLRHVGDSYLQCLNIASAACLCASEAEGYGLPVAEAARWGKPLILRDLPVFREIVGPRAFYFSGMNAESLADALRKWSRLFLAGDAPSSKGVVTHDWASSARMLMNALGLGDRTRRRTVKKSPRRGMA
ncbi:MAG: glycosyltransferase family 4 protein, partial [Desulfovibrionaceae bacterium]|nr:glycosyltransferase family 4 protein [Desulfovibrionaceae bacterium]